MAPFDRPIRLIGAGAMLAVLAWVTGAGCARESEAVFVLPAAPDASRLPAAFADARAAAEAKAREPATRFAGVAELGRLYHANGYWAEAAACWSALRAEEPTDARWPYFLADVWRETGHESRAVEQWRETTRLAPDYSRAWLRLADAALKSGDTEGAETAYARRLEQSPGDLFALLGLARCAAQTGRTDEAIERLRTAFAVDPQFAPVLNLLSNLLARVGSAAEADEMRVRASLGTRFIEPADPWLDELRQSSYDPHQWVQWGIKEAFAGREGVARACFERALELAPAQSEAYERLARLHADAGRTGVAVECLRRGVRLTDATESMWVSLGEMLMQTQRVAEALAVAEDGLRRHPGAAVILDLRGRVRALSGQQEAALTDFAAALAAMPHFADPALNQAMVHLQRQRLPAARAALGVALDRRPGFARAEVLLSEIDMLEGDMTAARDRLDSIMANDPRMPETRGMLARWYLRTIGAALDAGRSVEAAAIAAEGSERLPERRQEFAALLAGG